MIRLAFSFFILIATLIGQPSFGQTTSAVVAASFPVNAAATSMNLLFANPPLPRLDNVEGGYRFSVMPYSFNGAVNRTEEAGGVSGGTPGNTAPPAMSQSGSFNGVGFGTSFSRYLSQNWSLYILGMGANLTGDFQRTGATTNSGDTNATISGTRASYFMLGTAVGYHHQRKPGSRYSWSYFFGPTVTKASINGRVVETAAAGNGGGLVSDFDMNAEKVMPGFLLGAQFGIDVGDFRFVPFAILGGSFGDSGLTANNIRTNNNSKLLAAANRGETFPTGSGGGNVGLNVEYKPLKLALNVTAPFLKTPLFVEHAGEGITLAEISLAWSYEPDVKAPPQEPTAPTNNDPVTSPDQNAL